MSELEWLVYCAAFCRGGRLVDGKLRMMAEPGLPRNTGVCTRGQKPPGPTGRKASPSFSP